MQAAFALLHLAASCRAAAAPSIRPGSAITADAGAKVLLVIAHPDDECMFFGPSVQHFQEAGFSVHLLSLSTGVSPAAPAWQQLWHKLLSQLAGRGEALLWGQPRTPATGWKARWPASGGWN